MKVFQSEGVHIKSWANEIEPSAMAQIDNLAKLPFAYHHIAIMPDVHCGYGMPIGGVLAANGVVVPNAVGVDIGCGMAAIKTALKDISKDDLKIIMGQIRDLIPVGFSHHKESQPESLMPKLDFEACPCPVIRGQYASAMKQIGTLGGGNHFIEIQKGSDGHVWVMIHSGSRNLGKRVADHYNDIAKELNQRWYSSLDPKWDLAFLPIETVEARSYMLEMQYCVNFALANRKLMMDRIMGIFDVAHDPMINIAHNYARWENHFGKNVVVHRKGATLAREDTIGIIPGSQGSKSYIVRGKGNLDSFTSCSHGAGRKMGRGEATRKLVLADEIKRMEELGVIHGIRYQKDLDEAAGAYKDIDEVMKNQADLVEVLVELKPLAVIKA